MTMRNEKVPDGSMSTRERAHAIVNGWTARRGSVVDGEIVMPARGLALAMSLNDLEAEIARQIDLAERAAWCRASEAMKEQSKNQ